MNLQLQFGSGILASVTETLSKPLCKRHTCECRKCVLSIWPMFWVCERSSAASTSSRMYRGAGLKSSKERIRDKATSDLTQKQQWPDTEITRRGSGTRLPVTWHRNKSNLTQKQHQPDRKVARRGSERQDHQSPDTETTVTWHRNNSDLTQK